MGPVFLMPEPPDMMPLHHISSQALKQLPQDLEYNGTPHPHLTGRIVMPQNGPNASKYGTTAYSFAPGGPAGYPNNTSTPRYYTNTVCKVVHSKYLQTIPFIEIIIVGKNQCAICHDILSIVAYTM